MTFNPGQPGAAEPSKIDWGNALAGVACPSSRSAPQSTTRAASSRSTQPAAAVEELASERREPLCGGLRAQTTECVGVGNPQDTAVTFDPTGTPPSITLPIEKVDGSGHCRVRLPRSAPRRRWGARSCRSGYAWQCGACADRLRRLDTWHRVPYADTVHRGRIRRPGGHIQPVCPDRREGESIGISAPWGVACPSTEQCTAVGESKPPHSIRSILASALLDRAGGGFASAAVLSPAHPVHDRRRRTDEPRSIRRLN